jgi:hypothetical protein
MSDANAVIMTSVVVATGVTLIADQQENKLSMRPIIGGWVLGLILFLIATFDDDIAKAFAVLVLVTAVLMNGTKVFAAVGNATGTATNPTRTPNDPSPRFSKGSLNAV